LFLHEVRRSNLGEMVPQPTTSAKTIPKQVDDPIKSPAELQSIIRKLEGKLAKATADHQSMIEELQASDEEQCAANEELTALNEELQNANQQLETSQDHLASLNEELTRVNNELSVKIDELELKHADLENLIAATNVPVICLDRDFVIRWFSPSIQELIRVKASDRGRPLAHFAHGFLRDDLLPSADRVLERLEPLVDEIETRDSRIFKRQIMPYRSGDNRVGGVVVTFSDITGHKRAAEKLTDLNARLEKQVDERAKRNKLLASLIESTHDAIYVRSLTGRIITWNRGAEVLYGYSAEEAIGSDYLFLIPPDCRDEIEQKHALLHTHGALETFETRRKRNNGDEVVVSITLSLIRDTDENVIGIASIARDVSARKKAERMLEESESQLRAILNTAADAIITIDRHGKIVGANPAAERMFGYEENELVGQNVNILMPPPYCDEHENYLMRYVETGEKHIIGSGRELIHLRKDGSTFQAELAVSEAIPGKLFTGIIRDVSRRKELEKEVIEAEAREQRRIGQDIHDGIGQELTGLRYMAHTHAETLAKKGIEEAGIAQRISGWLELLQRNLRAVSRELVPVEIDAHGLVYALQNLASRTSQCHTVECELISQPPVVIDDPELATHLFRIAQEAVHNSVRHANASRITIQLECDDHCVRLMVTDNGVGIGRQQHASSGLGLSSMHYRAGLIQAQINITDAPAGGTRLTCAAPINQIAMNRS